MSVHETLKALDDPIRREILAMLKKGRLSAGEIAEQFDITGAAISRHLSVLKDADLVRDTREGKYIFLLLYPAPDPHLSGLINVWRLPPR